MTGVLTAYLIGDCAIAHRYVALGHGRDVCFAGVVDKGNAEVAGNGPAEGLVVVVSGVAGEVVHVGDVVAIKCQLRGGDLFLDGHGMTGGDEVPAADRRDGRAGVFVRNRVSGGDEVRRVGDGLRRQHALG
ncbi:MAG: hypothetical protein GXP23_03885, partial [Gammaproteobacteria bacterium]|nr:hypothetical protein [Gammaproteobacteria bacterium]